MPGYRELMMSAAPSQQAIPGGILAIVLIVSMIVGAFWGFLGAAVAQAGPFRPREA